MQAGHFSDADEGKTCVCQVQECPLLCAVLLIGEAATGRACDLWRGAFELGAVAEGLEQHRSRNRALPRKGLGMSNHWQPSIIHRWAMSPNFN